MAISRLLIVGITLFAVGAAASFYGEYLIYLYQDLAATSAVIGIAWIILGLGRSRQNRQAGSFKPNACVLSLCPVCGKPLIWIPEFKNGIVTPKAGTSDFSALIFVWVWR
jgi:uncharacterized membrane protein